MELQNMIEIDATSSVPAYRQLYLAMRELIETGVMPSGMHLPSIRNLAADLGLARNTVDTAYRQLKVEGYVKSKPGSGFVVEDLDFSVLDQKQGESSSLPEDQGSSPLGDTFGCTYDFSYGNRSADAFPIKLWRTFAGGVMSSDYAPGANTYTDSFGLPKLRVQIAQWLKETRGVKCTPEQIIIQPGTQPAIRNLLIMFGGTIHSVAFEEPGYDGARAAFESMKCKIVPIPVYKRIDAYLEALRKSRAKLAFVTPSSQFPLGYALPLSARLQLIDWAVKRDAYIIEDDYCCECRYDGTAPLPSLQSLDTHDRVIYLGTMSKILTPALRMSYVVLPPTLVAQWKQVFSREFCSVAWFLQEVLARFMASPQWPSYVHRAVNTYQNRHDLLIESLQREFGDSIDIWGEEAGYHLLVGTKDGRDADTLIDLAKQHDVRVYETDNYWYAKNHPMNNVVLLGYSAIEDELIPDGVKAIKEAWS